MPRTRACARACTGRPSGQRRTAWANGKTLADDGVVSDMLKAMNEPAMEFIARAFRHMLHGRPPARPAAGSAVGLSVGSPGARGGVDPQGFVGAPQGLAGTALVHLGWRCHQGARCGPPQSAAVALGRRGSMRPVAAAWVHRWRGRLKSRRLSTRSLPQRAPAALAIFSAIIDDIAGGPVDRCADCGLGSTLHGTFRDPCPTILFAEN